MTPKAIAIQSSMRVGKFLARAGVCSRREAERLIADGRVSVDGECLDTPAVRVGSGQDIRVDGRRVLLDDRVRLWRYHKPRGVLCTRSDPKGRATIFDGFDGQVSSLKAVGRLDMDSEGLLLLTNDGDFARHLELPSSGFERRYRVRVYGEVDQEKLVSLGEGISYRGIRYGPVRARLERQQTSANSWLEVSCAQGKNRQVRLVMQSIGLTVNRLVRTGFGPTGLSGLAQGAVEEVSASVLSKFGYPVISSSLKK